MTHSFQTFIDTMGGLALPFLVGLLVCVAFFVLSSLLSRKVVPALAARMDNGKHPAAVLLLRGFRRPVNLLLKVVGICVGLSIFSGMLVGHAMPRVLSTFLNFFLPIYPKIIRVSIILAVTWGLVASSEISALVLRGARHRLDWQVSKSVTHFLSAVFKVVVVAFAAVILISELGYDVNGLVAGLGLGGLTVALAVQDSAANFIGGLVLVTEKPFELGDWVISGGVEGTVEDINLRSTKIRTSSGALTVVPNASISGSPITNWGGGMEKRRADFVLSLTYDTTRTQMQQFTAAIATMLETDPDVLNDSIIVRFSAFSESSLDVRVIFYTAVTAFAQHSRVRERVNYALLQLAETHGVKFAFPSRSLYFENRDAASPLPAGTPTEDT